MRGSSPYGTCERPHVQESSSMQGRPPSSHSITTSPLTAPRRGSWRMSDIFKPRGVRYRVARERGTSRRVPDHCHPRGATVRTETAFLFDLDGTLVDSVYQHVL